MSLKQNMTLTFYFEWCAFFRVRRDTRVPLGILKSKSCSETFFSSYNFGHKVRICIKTILQIRANWHTKFLLFTYQSLGMPKSGNKYRTHSFYFKLSVKILCTDTCEMFISLVSSRTANRLYIRIIFATFCLFLISKDILTVARNQAAHL